MGQLLSDLSVNDLVPRGFKGLVDGPGQIIAGLSPLGASQKVGNVEWLVVELPLSRKILFVDCLKLFHSRAAKVK